MTTITESHFGSVLLWPTAAVAGLSMACLPSSLAGSWSRPPLKPSCHTQHKQKALLENSYSGKVTVIMEKAYAALASQERTR